MSRDLFDHFNVSRWGPQFPIRLIVGYGFLEHGLAKLTKGSDTLANIFQAVGAPAPHIMAWLTVPAYGGWSERRRVPLQNFSKKKEILCNSAIQISGISDSG